MFARILHSLAAFVFSHTTPSHLTSIFQADQQLQTELEQAAEQSMVSTRSKDNTPAHSAPQTSKPLYPLVLVHDQKRKIGNEGETSPAQAVTKRRRKSANSNGDGAPSSSAGKPGKPRGRPSTKTGIGDAARTTDYNEPGPESSTQGSPTSPQTSEITTKRPLDDNKEEKVVEVAVNKPNDINDPGSEVLDSHDQVKLNGESTTISRRSRKPKKKSEDLEEFIQMHKNGADTSPSGKKPETSFDSTAKATHKRFGSEDTDVPGAVHSGGIEERKWVPEGLSEDEGESGDEAPEIVTASAGFVKAHTLAQESAKVAARYVFQDCATPIVDLRLLIWSRQKAEKKTRRREHDQRLRLQAKSAKDSRSNDKPSAKSRKTKAVSTEVTEEANAHMPLEGLESSGESPKASRNEDRKPSARTRISGKNPLPLLLPEEILAARPVAQAPTPPSSTSKAPSSQKRKFLDVESKPPKDIKRGNVTIHVLQDNQSLLPPKCSQASKALRESWLIGRRGYKGAIGVPRRKPGSNFVRRS